MLERLLRLLIRLTKVIRTRLIPHLTAVLRFVFSPKQLISAWPEGDVQLGPKVALFVHFDSRGVVHEHVLHYVRSLADAGFSVVFVTNSGRRLHPAALAQLQPICARVLVRRNLGYDFGAWREAIEYLGLPRPDTSILILANDSVYGPLRPMGEILNMINFEHADVFGLTECWLSRYHLQSYFLAFGSRVLQSEAWSKFWTRVRPAPSKYWVIPHYEIGLSQALVRAGFRCQALWPYMQLIDHVDPALLGDEKEKDQKTVDPIVKARKKHAMWIRTSAVENSPMNPTTDLWRQLLVGGFPFIKRELLRDNPTNVPDVADWRSVAEENSTIDLTPILVDLQRTLRNRAP